MALTVPLIDPIQGTNNPSPVLQPYAKASDQSALNGLGDALTNTSVKVATDMAEQANTAVLLSQQKSLDDWEAKTLYDPQNGALQKRGQNALGVTQNTMNDFNTFAQSASQGLANGDQQMAFAKMVESRRNTIMRTLETHEGAQIDAFHTETAKAASDSAVNRAALYYNQPDIVNSSIDAAKAAQVSLGHFQGLPDEMIANNLLNVESKARLGVLTRMADNDPQSAVDYYAQNLARFNGEDSLAAQRLIEPTQRKVKSMNLASQVLANQAPKVDQNGVIDFVMNNLEGGDKLTTDSNGAQVKFGINAAANPDLDVPNLTSDQAKQRYVANYWNKINGDQLPAALRLPAMSFAVTSGAKEANDLIEQSGGDPRKFQELAQQFYQGLAAKDPAQYGPSLPGWMNRLANVSSQIDYMRGQLPDMAAMNNQINAQATDPIVAADAKTLVKAQIDAMKETQDNNFKAASQEAWRYKQNNMEVPPSVVSRMNPKEAEEMQANGPPDPLLYEQSRQQILAGQPVDLSAMRWRLGNKYDDLIELQGDPVKQAQNSVVDDTVNKALPAILGKSKIQTADDYQKVDQFRNAVASAVKAQEKVMGKVITPQDVQGITDKMLLKGSPGFWSSSKPLFRLGNTPSTIDNIPATGQHFIGTGTAVTQNDVVDTIVKRLRNQGLVVNDANVSNEYDKMKNAGLVKYVPDGSTMTSNPVVTTQQNPAASGMEKYLSFRRSQEQ